MKPEVLTVKEVAAYLRVAPRTIYRLIRQRDGQAPPAFRVGNDWRFHRPTLEAWMADGVKEGIRNGVGK